MSEALNGIFYFYQHFINFVFNDMLLFTGVTFGWVIIAISVFGFIIRSVIALPRSLNVTESTYSEKRHGSDGTVYHRSLSGISNDTWRAK